jgi:polyhydroxybutyrate depolymerase
MTATLACARPELLAGIAIITASIPELLLPDCAAVPLPAMIMNGTDDPLVPYDGGNVIAGDVVRGVASATEETAAFWREANACDAEPDVTETHDARPFDGTSVDVLRYESCKTGAPLALVRVNGGGHTLPGAAQYLPRAIIGVVSREVDGAALIFAFFAEAAT